MLLYIGDNMDKYRENNTNKINQFKKPFRINIGMVIFATIFLYIIVVIIVYATSKHIVAYEVKAGSLSVSNEYTGIALRQEEVVNATTSGYTSYFLPVATRAGKNELICAVDSGNELESLLKTSGDETDLINNTDLDELRKDMIDFAKTYKKEEFSKIYSFKQDVDAYVMKTANISILASLDNLSLNELDGQIQFERATNTGIVVYNVDGYESFTSESLTAKDFLQEEYHKDQLTAGQLVEAGDPLYKIIDSENWTITIPVDSDRLSEFVEDDYVDVRFLKTQEDSWGKIRHVKNADGNYIELTFNNSMISFAKDRFIDIEILSNQESGLKIPNSSIIEKTFFLVPKDFVIKGDSKGVYYVLREVYMEDGTKSVEQTELSLYSENEDTYYIDTSRLRAGDHLIKLNSSESFTVNEMGTLIGVYNINKGYADFTQIIILYSNDEYSIVQSNTKYGLNVYDYIVLDATTVEEDDLLY